MTLYELIKVTQEDYDVYDNEYDYSITVCYIEEDDDNDDYDRFCNGIIKKVNVVKGIGDGCGLVADWSELIKRNMDKFKAFTKKHWHEDCQYEDDDEEFVYQWIIEIENYMIGLVSENFYKCLIAFVEELI